MQATVYVERQLTEGVGARVGFVLLHGQRPDQHAISRSRPASRLHRAVRVRRQGTGQHRRQRGRSDADVLRHPDVADQRLLREHHLADADLRVPTTKCCRTRRRTACTRRSSFSLNKRQSHNYSAAVGFGYTWKHDFPLHLPEHAERAVRLRLPGAEPQAQRHLQRAVGHQHQPGLSGTRQARTSRARSSVSAPASCACTFSAARGGSLTNTTVYADEYGDNKQDNISVLDVRVEKTVNLGEAAKVRAVPRRVQHAERVRRRNDHRVDAARRTCSRRRFSVRERAGSARVSSGRTNGHTGRVSRTAQMGSLRPGGLHHPAFFCRPRWNTMATIMSWGRFSVVTVSLCLVLAWSIHALSQSNRPAGPTFVGAQACAACHQQIHADWKGARHSKMMQPATPASVIGDFSKDSVTLQGQALPAARRQRRVLHHRVVPHRQRTGTPGRATRSAAGASSIT